MRCDVIFSRTGSIFFRVKDPHLAHHHKPFWKTFGPFQSVIGPHNQPLSDVFYHFEPFLGHSKPGLMNISGHFRPFLMNWDDYLMENDPNDQNNSWNGQNGQKANNDEEWWPQNGGRKKNGRKWRQNGWKAFKMDVIVTEKICENGQANEWPKILKMLKICTKKMRIYTDVVSDFYCTVETGLSGHKLKCLPRQQKLPNFVSRSSTGRQQPNLVTWSKNLTTSIRCFFIWIQGIVLEVTLLWIGVP